MSKKLTTSEAARLLSARGASKGGKARAKALTPERRKEISQLAVKTRWSRAQRLAFLLKDILSRMDHTFDPKTGNHHYTMNSPLIMTDEAKGFLDSLSEK